MLTKYNYLKLYICYRHDICKHSRSCHARTGSIALNEHRILAIALGGEQYNIVGALKIIERMMLSYCLKRHARLAVLELCHKSPALVLALQHLALCLEVGIERRKILPEVIYAALEELVGHEEMLLHIVLFYLISCLAREDDELSHHVLTAQVNARVGLAITLLLGSQYSLGERHICRNLIEDKVERSTQNCLNLKYFITRVR